jgi:metal-dependent hydrolase (beta-lactamase superfamily II)
VSRGIEIGVAGEGLRITIIIREFRRLGVPKVSATHCTGDEAIALFQAAYGEDYRPGGVGRVFVISDR